MSRSVRVVVYEDLECPDCAEFDRMLDEKLLPRYGAAVTFEHRDFPLVTHTWSRKGAIAARFIAEVRPALADDFRRHVMGRQMAITRLNFNEMLGRYAESNGIDRASAIAALDDPKLAAAVQADFEEGVAQGITHTPTVLVNDQRFIEHFTYEEIARAIDSELAANR